jgi:phosphoserine/homoserine phosphotransferase
MYVICSDLEGVFVPEIWINVAIKTGIEELRLTTRDISDYDILMQKRLAILKENNLKLKDITEVIATMEPMAGAVEMIEWLRSRAQLIVLSDTFVEFAKPLMQKLGWPTLFCHSLIIDESGAIADYNLRQPEGKKRSVLAMQSLNYNVIAMGDSYNDITMLKEADHGILFRPPQNVVAQYPELPVTYEYQEVQKRIKDILAAKGTQKL